MVTHLECISVIVNSWGGGGLQLLNPPPRPTPALLSMIVEAIEETPKK